MNVLRNLQVRKQWAERWLVLAAALTSDVTVGTAHACESLAATDIFVQGTHMVVPPFSYASMHDSGLCGAVSETVATNRCNKRIGGACMHGTTEGIEPASGRPVPDRQQSSMRQRKRSNFARLFFATYLSCFLSEPNFHCTW
jgi:hypothetical protein